MKTEKSKDNLFIKILALVGFPLLIVTIVLAFIFNFNTIVGLFKNSESIKTLLSQWGIFAPLVFIGLQILQVVVFIIPGEVTQLAGGYLFGTVMGSIYSIVGIVIGSGINFYLGRLLGIPFVKALFKEDQIGKFESLTSTSKSKNITTITIFVLFLIPGFPKDIVTYFAGLTPMAFPLFLLVSGIGRLPGILVSTVIGDAAAGKNWPLVIIVSVIAAGLFITGYLLKDKVFGLFKDKMHKESSENIETSGKAPDTKKTES
jgi:uncharacterized membrane protein YdjX (TVP38/TMEM64 family)